MFGTLGPFPIFLDSPEPLFPRSPSCPQLHRRFLSADLAVRTSRNPDRQKEQLEAVEVMPALTSEEVEAINDAGKGWFRRHFQLKVWDAARP